MWHKVRLMQDVPQKGNRKFLRGWVQKLLSSIDIPLNGHLSVYFLLSSLSLSLSLSLCYFLPLSLSCFSVSFFYFLSLFCLCLPYPFCPLCLSIFHFLLFLLTLFIPSFLKQLKCLPVIYSVPLFALFLFSWILFKCYT